MKALLCLVSMTSGTSNKSGSPVPYSIPEVYILSPAVSSNRNNRKTEAFGLLPVPVAVSDEFFPELMANFSRDFKGQPVEYDFKTSMAADSKTILIGFEKSVVVPPVVGASFVPPVAEKAK